MDGKSHLILKKKVGRPKDSRTFGHIRNHNFIQNGPLDGFEIESIESFENHQLPIQFPAPDFALKLAAPGGHTEMLFVILEARPLRFEPVGELHENEGFQVDFGL